MVGKWGKTRKQGGNGRPWGNIRGRARKNVVHQGTWRILEKHAPKISNCHCFYSHFSILLEHLTRNWCIPR